MMGRRLSTLPTEILDAILSFNIQYCAFQLWKCGDTLLNHLLAYGGITEIVLESKNRKSQNRWPLLLTHFRKLRVLDINCPNQLLGDIDRVRREVMKLSPTLKTLKLHFEAAQEVILEPCEPERLGAHLLFPDDDIEDSTADISTLNMLENAVESRRMWPMQEKFPKLEYLEIGVAPNAVGFPFSFGRFPESLKVLKLSLGFVWRLDHTHILPAGLEILDLENCYVSTEYASKHIPPGLLSFQGCLTSENNDLLRYLPESITSLGAIQMNFAQSSPPPNLTSLDISHDYITPAVRFLEIIPASVTKLSVLPTQICEKFETIPNTISSLVVKYQAIMPVSIWKFPTQLTSLRSEYPIHSTEVSLLPGALTYLSASLRDPGGAVLAINSLPRALLTLSMGELYFSSDPSTKCLPKLIFPPNLRQLYSLIVRLRQDDSHLVIEEFVRQLPRSLSELSLGFEGEFSIEPHQVELLTSIGRAPTRSRPPHEQFSIWPSNVVSALPPHLLHLNTLRFVQIAGYDYHRLPRTLLHYKTEAVTGTLPALHHHFADLPPSLVTYSVNTYPDDSTININYVLPSQRAKNELAPLNASSPLNPSTFRGDGIVTYHVPEDWASALPKTLTEFQAYIPLDCTDCGKLPRGLKSLVVKSLENLHSEHVRALPRRLTKLLAYGSCPASDVTPADLPPVVEQVPWGFQPLWTELEGWFRRIRPHILPYRIAYPSNPEDPKHLQTILHEY